MGITKKRPVVLCVLDGWGYREATEGNAIRLARVPTWDALWREPSRTLLEASGRAVGLPTGQMGNSEVGHLNLGAGRIVPQDLVRITLAIEDGSFFRNPEFLRVCKAVRERGGTLHLMGLLGDGGVHAVDTHLFALIDLAEREAMPSVAIHALLDGRDTLPHSALGFMRELLGYARGRAKVATIGGRYYGMDRDRRWDRVGLWYDAMVKGEGARATDPLAAIQAAYDAGETDEFIKPIVIVHDDLPVATIRDGDGIIFLNYRADRMRQIVRALTDDTFTELGGGRPKADAVMMTMYDERLALPAAFPPFVLSRIVPEVISERGMTMLKTAETEKYPHVTYFFNGGFETPYPGEERRLVASQKHVATYDLMPEMSAPGITDVLCDAIERRDHDFILCNYANGDMVGHSGVLPATIQAVETVDRCLARVLRSAEVAGARVIITADHGNCEQMIDPETGGPHTAHTTNPVPLVIVDPQDARPLRAGGALQDVGPTVLAMLGVELPSEMTGVDLRSLDAPRAARAS